MNKQEKIYFEKLVDTRQKFFDQIKEAEEVGTVEGYWDSVVDKYSDQAHFIYEILQNADDALAKNAYFELYEDCLVFRHDGERRFSISNPDTYKSDRSNNRVGDINGITSIGGSGKFLDDAKIGKFGLGFKAVFQYTLTPSIYDDNASFKIHDYIVPQIIAEDYPKRKQGETIFVFPFDRPDISPKEAYEDIKEKLSNLIFPNLFLNNLEAITYNCSGEGGVFKKEILTEGKFDGIVAQLIKVTKGQEKDADKIWLFSRTDDNYRYSVGYFLDANGRVIAADTPYTAFCFFPTLVTTNLNFIIHAPFLLTDNREGIMAGDEHNKKMITDLAILAADGIECLCKIGGGSRKRLVDDEILEVVPFQESLFSSENDRSKVSFMPFYTEIRDRFQSKRILPIRNGFTTTDKAYWGDTEDIPKLISDEQLSQLLETEAHFVFVSKGRNSTLHNATSGKGKYIDSIVYDKISEDDIYRQITAEFIEKQDEKWLIKLYRYILEGRNRTTRIRKIRELPIFLDTNGCAVAAYDENNHESLFLPDDEETGYTTINEGLYKNQHVRKILEELEIKKPEREDRIFKKIIPQYDDNGKKQNGSTRSDFRLFLKYYIECEGTDKEDDFIDSIKNLYFIEAVSADGNDQYIAKASELYMPTEELKTYFAGMEDILFVNLKKYEGFIGKKEWKGMNEFLAKVGVYSNARRYWKEYGSDDYETVKILFGTDWPDYTRSKSKQRKWKDARLLGGEDNVNRIIETQSKELSKLLWEQLIALFGRVKPSNMDNVLGGVHTYPDYGKKYRLFEGKDAVIFREMLWVVNRDGEFVKPKGLLLQDLASFYDTESNGIDGLAEYLEIYEEDESNLSDSQRKK